MDDRQFDQFTRRVGDALAPALPRRGLLGLLGGATLGGALGLLAADSTDAAKNKKRKKDKKKKKCKKDGKKCDRNKDCCDDLKCKNNRCGGSSSKCFTNANFNKNIGGFGSSNGKFNSPWGIGTDPDGNFYVTDQGNNRIQALNKNGGFLGKFGSSGNGSNHFQEVRGIGFVTNNSRDYLFVADPVQSSQDARLRRFQIDLEDDPIDVSTAIEGESGLNQPRDIAIDSSQNVWVVNATTPGRIFRFSRSGSFLDEFEPSFSSPNDDLLESPEGIAVWRDTKNDRTFVFIADTQNNRIVKFEHVSSDLEEGLDYIDEVGSTGSGDRNFNQPLGLAVDKCGNLWVADRINNRVKVYSKNLDLIDVVTHSFNRPTDVAVSAAGNALFVVDSLNDRVQKFDLD